MGAHWTATLCADAFAQEFQSFYDRADVRQYDAKPQKGRNLHAVLVIDTNAKNAEKLGISADGANFLALLKALFANAGMGHRLATVNVLASDAVSPDGVIAAINDIRSEADDTLLFYYSGHGAVDEKLQARLIRDQITSDNLRYDFDNAHLLALSSGILPRSKIKAALAERPGQFRIIMTDCCANFPSRSSAAAAARGAMDPSGADSDEVKSASSRISFRIEPHERLCDLLFFESVGWASIGPPPSQTTPGGRYGGIFTNGVLAKVNELNDRIKNNAVFSEYVWKDLGKVPIKRRSDAEPVPNPGGVRDGLEDPRLMYSFIYASGTPIEHVRIKN